MVGEHLGERPRHLEADTGEDARLDRAEAEDGDRHIVGRDGDGNRERPLRGVAPPSGRGGEEQEGEGDHTTHGCPPHIRQN